MRIIDERAKDDDAISREIERYRKLLHESIERERTCRERTRKLEEQLRASSTKEDVPSSPHPSSEEDFVILNFDDAVEAFVTNKINRTTLESIVRCERRLYEIAKEFLEKKTIDTRTIPECVYEHDLAIALQENDYASKETVEIFMNENAELLNAVEYFLEGKIEKSSLQAYVRGLAPFAAIRILAGDD